MEKEKMKIRMFLQGSVTVDDLDFIPTPEQATTAINESIYVYLLCGYGKSELVCDYVSVKEEGQIGKRTETHDSDYISILSELRSQYNCFDEADQPYYHALSEAIKVLSAEPETQL